MTRLTLIKTLRKDIAFLFLICISTIICIDFWLKDIPEIFRGGAKIGDIVYKLCLSYTSAFIFYFLVVHIKAQKDKANLYHYVAKKVDMVIGSATGLITELANAANITLAGQYPTDAELTTICNTINPKSNSPLLLFNVNRHANWIEYFDNQKQRSNDATEKVFSKMPFLDTKLVDILARIEDCPHFMSIKYLLVLPFNNQDLTNWKSTLAGYFALIEELDKYAKKKLKDFQ